MTAIGIAARSGETRMRLDPKGKSPARQGSPNDFNNFRNGVIHG